MDLDPDFHQHLDGNTHLDQYPDFYPDFYPNRHFHSILYTNLHTAAHPDAHTNFYHNLDPFGYTTPIRNAYSCSDPIS